MAMDILPAQGRRDLRREFSLRSYSEEVKTRPSAAESNSQKLALKVPSAAAHDQKLEKTTDFLLDLLANGDIDKQRDAADALAKLGSRVSDRIRATGVTSLLVERLSSPDLSIGENMMTLLFRLAANDEEKYRQQSRSSANPSDFFSRRTTTGVIHHMLRLGPGAKGYETAATVLIKLSNNERLRHSITSSGGIDALIEMLRFKRGIRFQKDAIATLLRLLRGHDENKARAVRGGLPRILLNILVDGSPEECDMDGILHLMKVLAFHDWGHDCLVQMKTPEALMRLVKSGKLAPQKEQVTMVVRALTEDQTQAQWALSRLDLAPVPVNGNKGIDESPIKKHFGNGNHQPSVPAIKEYGDLVNGSQGRDLRDESIVGKQPGKGNQKPFVPAINAFGGGEKDEKPGKRGIDGRQQVPFPAFTASGGQEGGPKKPVGKGTDNEELGPFPWPAFEDSAGDEEEQGESKGTENKRQVPFPAIKEGDRKEETKRETRDKQVPTAPNKSSNFEHGIGQESTGQLEDAVGTKPGPTSDVQRPVPAQPVDYTQRAAEIGTKICVPVPEEFCCPISKQLMKDPVTVSSDVTYDRECIQKRLDQGKMRCPKSKYWLKNSNLKPNHNLKLKIVKWCEKHGLDSSGASILSKERIWLDSPASDGSSKERNGNPDSSREIRKVISLERNELGPVELENNHKEERQEPESVQDKYPKQHDSKEPLKDEEQAENPDDNKPSATAAQEPAPRGSPEPRHNRYRPVSGRHPVKPRNGQQIDPGESGLGRAEPSDPSFGDVRSRDQETVSTRIGGGSVPAVSEDPENRVAPEELPEDARPPTDEELARVKPLMEVLRSSASSETDLRTAALELHDLAFGSHSLRDDMGTMGVVDALAGLLAVEHVDTTREAGIATLLVLSLNDGNKKRMAHPNSAVLPAIIGLLKNGSENGREKAASTMFCLSVLDENKVSIGATDAIPTLVDILSGRDPLSRKAQKDAATCLLTLSIYLGNKARAVRAGVVPYLVALLDDDSSLLDLVLAMLFVLSSHAEGRHAIENENVLPKLTEIMRSGTDRNIDNALTIYSALIMKNPALIKEAERLGAHETILELDRSSGSDKIKTKTLRLREFVVRHSVRHATSSTSA